MIHLDRPCPRCRHLTCRIEELPLPGGVAYDWPTLCCDHCGLTAPFRVRWVRKDPPAWPLALS
jgi:hypothetical protein